MGPAVAGKCASGAGDPHAIYRASMEPATAGELESNMKRYTLYEHGTSIAESDDLSAIVTRDVLAQIVSGDSEGIGIVDRHRWAWLTDAECAAALMDTDGE